MAWRLELNRAAEKVLERLPDRDRDRILAAMLKLAEDPFATPNVKALAGQEGYRLRVGDYRILYQLETEVRVIRVERVGQRGGFYR